MQFSYTARDKSGVFSKGTVTAADRNTAASSLIAQNLTPIILTEDSKAAGGGGIRGLLKLGKGEHIPLQERVIFSRQFSTMISAGVPIVQALSILREQSSNKNMKAILTDLTKQVEGGVALSTALGKHTQAFSKVYINLVKAGEAGGILDQTLERLADQMEKDHELVSKVRGAMIYPAVITVVMVGVFFFLMLVIIPQLAAVFSQLGGQLPWYTTLLLNLSHFLVKFGVYAIVALIVAAIFTVRAVRKNEAIRYRIDQLILRLPILGPISSKINIARFTRTLGLLMQSGVTVLDAIEIVSGSLSNRVIQKELSKIATEVKNGSPIADPIKKSPYFPKIVSEMIAVGEATGSLDQILTKLAGFYEKEVDTVIENLSSIIEPVFIIMIGAMVGFIVVAVIAPIYQLSQSI